jgi:ankyrin repeat protein
MFTKLLFQVNARNIDSATPLCYASYSGNIDCVRLLLDAGAEVNSQFSFFTTPLHEAAVRGMRFMM